MGYFTTLWNCSTATISRRSCAYLYGLGCLARWLLGEGKHAPAELHAVIRERLLEDPARRPPSARNLADRLSSCHGLGTWAREDAGAWWAEAGRHKT